MQFFQETYLIIAGTFSTSNDSGTFICAFPSRADNHEAQWLSPRAAFQRSEEVEVRIGGEIYRSLSYTKLYIVRRRRFRCKTDPQNAQQLSWNMQATQLALSCRRAWQISDVHSSFQGNQLQKTVPAFMFYGSRNFKCCIKLPHEVAVARFKSTWTPSIPLLMGPAILWN